MLDNARPIHPINIRQRNRLRLLINPDMDQPQIIIEVLPQNFKRSVGDDAAELGLVGGAALLVEGVVLNQVGGDVGVEGEGGVLGGVER